MLCIVLLIAAWVLDLLTPQLFVVAILFNGPIALSCLLFDRRFTISLIVGALLANVSAGYANGAADHNHWDVVAIGDRVIAGLSFLLVGMLSMATQRSAQRAGEYSAREEQAARERVIHRSVEAIRSSMNTELIARAIAREARAALDADSATVYLTQPGLDVRAAYVSTTSDDVRVIHARPPPGVLSVLERVIEENRILRFDRTDALGRLVLDTFSAAVVIAAPISEHATYGVLFIVRSTTPFHPRVMDSLGSYVEQSAMALAQAHLFVALAQRNAQLASANEQLTERSEIIRDIVYAISHDLRTPLMAAGMTMEQALSGAYGELPLAYRDVLVQTLRGNDDVQRLAETLLLVSRYESGDQSTVRAHVEIEPLLRRVMSDLTPLWRTKRVHIAIEACDPAVHVLADEPELRRVMINVTANAVTWTPPEGHVRIVIQVHEAVVEIRFEDSGFGVPLPERPHLFERVRGTPARHGAGSGLGLFIARRIVRAHGGDIVYMPGESIGSTFVITLPLAPVPARQ